MEVEIHAVQARALVNGELYSAKVGDCEVFVLEGGESGVVLSVYPDDVEAFEVAGGSFKKADLRVLGRIKLDRLPERVRKAMALYAVLNADACSK